MSRVLIKNCTVLPMVHGPLDPGDFYYRGELAIEDDRIAFVGTPGIVPADWKADRVIDATGMVALPGLINCHTHAAMTLLRGYADDLPLMQWLEEKIWPLEANLTGDDIYWGTMLCIVEMLRSGTTTFADMYFEMDRVAEAVAQTGIRAVLSRGIIGVQDNALEALEQNKEFVKKWNGAAEGRIGTMFGPHAPYTCPPDFLERVIQEAGDLDVGIHIHLAETMTEVEEIKGRYGLRPVELMEKVGLFRRPVLAAHCVHLDEKEIDILLRHGVGVSHNPESNMKLASGVAPIPKMIAKGIKLGLGTDGAASNNNLDLLEEARTAALLHKVQNMDPTVLSSYQALYLATKGGATALGLEQEIGSLEIGKKADFILVDLDKPHLYPHHDVLAHLVYSAHSDDVYMVMVDGNILMENGEVRGIEIGRILKEVEARAMRLAK